MYFSLALVDQLLQSLRAIILEEGLYDSSNPSTVMCSAELELVLNRKALHVAEIWPLLMSHLIRSKLQPAPSAPRPTSSQPTPAPSSRTSSVVLKTTPGADQEQTYYLYSEVVKLVSEYIIAHPRVVDPRHVQLAIVEDDPLGAALGVKAFHRWQVPSFIRNQLQSSCFRPGSAPPLPSTSSSSPTLGSYAADPKKVWYSMKRKAAVLEEVVTTHPPPRSSGDPAHGSVPLGQRQSGGQKQQPVSTIQEPELGGDNNTSPA
jgi:hypothetical protein